MFSYAVKRISRGRGLFLALFLSVALASTLFSGTLQGADAVGASLLNKALGATDVDIISTAQDKNLTRTNVYDIDGILSQAENVESVDHFVRWKALVNVTGWNGTQEFTLIALPDDSSLLEGISGVDKLEDGKIYVDTASFNAPAFIPGERATLHIDTYQPFGLPDFRLEPYDFVIGGAVNLDDRAFSIATARYTLFLSQLLIGSEETGRRPQYQLILMGEGTLRGILDPIYANSRRGTNDIFAVALIRVDRAKLVNSWDVEGSAARVRLVMEDVNSLGAQYKYLPRNFLGEVLKTIEDRSSQMKTSSLLVAAPVFFTAWYLGVTVSSVSLGLRRREIGLLFTRGLTHKQVLYIFLFEGLLVSLLAGILGVLLGAAMLPLVIPGVGLQIFGSISLVTVAASLAFSGGLALLAVYKPARDAVRVSIVDSLREYQEEEASTGSWQEPLLALLLGSYRIAMLMLGLTVGQFRPENPNLVVSILYSTWWGVDYLLSFIAPILFFWGFIKLFTQHVPWFHTFMSRVSQLFAGEVARFSAISSRRNMRRTAAFTFMVALIVGYGVTIIGSLASADDFMERSVKGTIGADASVWLFDGERAPAIASQIGELEGVASEAVETWFSPESSLGVIPVRAIEPLKWRDTAYLEEGWLEGEDAFEKMMDGDSVNVILERGAARALSIDINDPMVVKLGSQVFTLNVVGLFGKEPGGSWSLQNPTLYVPDSFLDKVKDKYITQRRILVDLEEGADLEAFAAAVEALDPDVDRVSLTEEQLRSALSNVFLAGPRRVEELGVYFSAMVASVGVVIVVSTMLRSRWKELTIMAIRGIGPGQLTTTILVENVGMSLFAAALGLVVGFISLWGETELFNSLVGASLERFVVFPLWAQLNLALVVGLMLLSAAVPVMVAVRRVSRNPVWRTEE